MDVYGQLAVLLRGYCEIEGENLTVETGVLII